jgi:hypothetical protein
MYSLASILLLVERGDRVHEGLNKALMLARHFHARLDLFLCDTEGYVQLQPGPFAAGARTRAWCIAEGSDYLQALRKSIVAPDVEIASEAVCHGSLREAVAEKAARSATDLIVKTTEASRRDAGGRGAAEWAAIAACPAPLLLTRGRSWRPVPQFAAALELSQRSTSASTRAVADLSEALALVCGAELDLLWVGPGRAAECDDPSRRGARPAGDSTRPVPVRRPHFLDGAAADVIPAFVVERDCDLVVLEKPRLTGSAALGSIAGKILAMTGVDVVLTDAAMSGARYASWEGDVHDRRACDSGNAAGVEPRHTHPVVETGTRRPVAGARSRTHPFALGHPHP